MESTPISMTGSAPSRNFKGLVRHRRSRSVRRFQIVK
jgi:hypothetical protein